ncbi:hypothetical protein AX17_004843 [Amanita inopinata Kibby_2008]|nr:hypothetical protein AX17_004843 [Amanita inopinata Kibby_2008]
MASNTPLSWPRPPPFTWPSIPTRTPLPVYPPPPSRLTQLPPLPSPPRHPSLHSSFKLSTHLVPAAYLRTTRYVPPPKLPPVGVTKAERMERLRGVVEELKSVRGSTVTEGYERVLWNCVNRYYRVDPEGREGEGKGKGRGLGGEGQGGLTLFFAHANGFPKEIWEPTLKHLLASSAHLINEIWVWEAVQHGDAALVNEKSLSYLYDWIDNTRDILNFFTFYIPSSPSPSTTTLPTHLTRVSDAEAAERQKRGLPARKIIAIGHSYGGCTSALAALTNPDLFSSLILLDPVIVKPLKPEDPKDHTDRLTLGALARRETWKSKDEALSLFKANPFFAAWDPAVLDIYVECGLYPSPDGEGVRLKMSGLQEAVVFVEVHTENEVYHQMPGLDEKIGLRWVMPGPHAPQFGPPGSGVERVWLRPKNASNVIIPKADHLIAQEAPKELGWFLLSFVYHLLAFVDVPKADDIRDFLHREYEYPIRVKSNL